MPPILLLFLACGGASSSAEPVPAPPPKPDPVAPPPAPEPAALPAGPAGHCAADEQVAFSCATRGGKALSVCVTGEAVQYRFGPVGAPELVYPDPPGAGGLTLEEVTYVRAMGYVLRFANAGVTYEVTSLSGGGCCSPEEAAANNFQGVRVAPPGADTVEISCAGEVHDALGLLLASGKVSGPQ